MKKTIMILLLIISTITLQAQTRLAVGEYDINNMKIKIREVENKTLLVESGNFEADSIINASYDLDKLTNDNSNYYKIGEEQMVEYDKLGHEFLYSHSVVSIFSQPKKRSFVINGYLNKDGSLSSLQLVITASIADKFTVEDIVQFIRSAKKVIKANVIGNPQYISGAILTLCYSPYSKKMISRVTLWAQFRAQKIMERDLQ